MELTKERQKEKKARAQIVAALSEYHSIAPRVPTFTKDRIPGDKYDKEVTREGIDEGIVCLALLNNMGGGSVGEVDLYSLLHRYLLDKVARQEINSILRNG